MSKFMTFRLWILLVILVLSLMSIFASSNGITFLQKGVLITDVEKNSSEFEQGLKTGQVLIAIDGNKINNLEEYLSFITNKNFEGERKKTILTTQETEVIIFSNSTPKISVSEIPKTNLKMGLDLRGGSKALVQAKDKQLSSKEVIELADVIENRLNVFGISDLKVIPRTDLFGENRLSIEIAGATPKELEELISKQGKFEAKIGNQTVFVGGEKDIASVSRNAQDMRLNCPPSSTYCTFEFVITLSKEAAEKHAEITSKIPVNKTLQGNYLEEKLDLFLDDKLVSSLLISENLKGKVTTQIAISGSEQGETLEEAYESAKKEMNRLQTVLVTGSLPYQLEIVKLDTISPILGKDFIGSIFLAGILALVAVVVIIFARYRAFKASIAILFTSISEIVIILGIAALIEWNLDLPSIAGILATIGTGIDQQIIILDESKQKNILSLKQKLKRAFSIILGAYFTSVVSLLPLIIAGAGMLKGFAITTIIGISAGVLITRPAFTDLIKKIGE